MFALFFATSFRVCLFKKNEIKTLISKIFHSFNGFAPLFIYLQIIMENRKKITEKLRIDEEFIEIEFDVFICTTLLLKLI